MMIAVCELEKRFLTAHLPAISLHLEARTLYDSRLRLRRRIRQPQGCFNLSRRASTLPLIAALDRLTRNMAEK